MNKEEIKKILPHREPMLLIDQANLINENTAEGFYTVRGDEYFLQGHSRQSGCTRCYFV